MCLSTRADQAEAQLVLCINLPVSYEIEECDIHGFLEKRNEAVREVGRPRLVAKD